MEDCIVLTKCQSIEMPVDGETTKFRSFRETAKIPFLIYADLESLLENLTDMTSSLTETSKITTEQDKTEKLQKHTVCSYGYKVVCCYDKSMSKTFKIYRGLNSVNKFFSNIFEEENEILDKLKQFKNTPMNLTSEEKIYHENAESCYVCDSSFTIENRKVRVTGSNRGAFCNECNLGRKLTKTIHVIFPNLRGYDSHLLLPELGKLNKKYQSYLITCRHICLFWWVIKHHISMRKPENK